MSSQMASAYWRSFTCRTWPTSWKIRPTRKATKRRYADGLSARKKRSLINADLYSPPAQGAPMPTPTAGMRTLYQNMRKQKLDVAQHVPIHGRVGTNDEFLKIVGNAAPATGSDR